MSGELNMYTITLLFSSSAGQKERKKNQILHLRSCARRVLIGVHPFRPFRPSFPSDGSPQRIDDSSGGISRRIDVVVGVGRRDAVERGVVESAAVGEDPIDGVVRHLRRAAVLFPVVVVRV